ncbi:MAG: polysaccharide biosynthesis C-terminal domain-containing protein [Candidatus Binatia bacterium]
MASSLRKTTMGTFWAGLASFAMSLGMGIITARVLGPNDRGIFTLVSVLPHTVVAFVKLGLAQASIYAIKRERTDPALVASHLMVITAVASAAGVVGMYFLKFEAMRVLMKGAPLACFAFAMFLVPFLIIESHFSAILQGIGHFEIFNRRRLVAGALGLVSMFTGLVLLRGGLLTALVIIAGLTVFMETWLVVTVYRLCRIRFAWDAQLTRRLLKFGVKSHLQGIATHLHFRADVYLVAGFLNPSQVAFYSIATRLAELVLFVPESLGLVIYPRQAGSAVGELQELTARSCRHVMFTTTLGGLALVLIGPRLVVAWYGQAYAPAGPPLYYLMPGVVMMSLFFILSRNFTSQNRQGINILASGIALGSNVLLNLFLIPRMGISGAALATLLSYSLATLVLTYAYLADSGKRLAEVFVIRASDLLVYRRLVGDVLNRGARVARPAAEG